MFNYITKVVNKYIGMKMCLKCVQKIADYKGNCETSLDNRQIACEHKVCEDNVKCTAEVKINRINMTLRTN
jgi:hypothetical protein